MKKSKTIFIISSLLLLVVLGGWNYFTEKDEYADYYYYQGSQYHLDRTYDRVFFEFTSNYSLSDVRSLLGSKSALFNLAGYDPSENRQILELNSPQDDASLKELVKDLNLLSGIENASPVFKMPEGKGNPNTYIGVEKEIIAQFKDNVTDNAVQSYLSRHSLSISGEFDVSGGRTYLIRIPQGEHAINFANDLYLSGLVNYSEPNLFFTNLMQSFTPNDPLYPQQWSHRNTGNNIPQGVTGIPGCDMRTDSAWDVTTGSPKVIVSIVDSGIDTLHEDLSQRIINGLSINTFSNLPNAWDDNNHGTACSGIVAATGNNNMGVTGVAPLSRLFGVKIFNSAGSTNSTAIINGMVAAWQRGSWVSSNSWGGGSPISAADNAILDGVNLGRNGKGVVWCFATGNSNASSISWPSTLSTVISVGGVSPCNQRKSTSSCDGETWWGAQYGTGLEIVSPCAKIYTTDRTGSVGYSTGNYVENFNGTSSATPNVSGVCALVLAVDSNLTWDSVRVRIARTADKVGSYTYNQPGQLGIGGWNNEMGYGKINANRVVRLTQEMVGGTPLIPFSLQNPQPNARIVSYPSSTSTATFSWDTTGVNASFNWFFGTSLPNRLIMIPTGTNKQVTLTLGELDNILANLGVAVGDSLVGQWNVMAYRAPNTSGLDSLSAANGPRSITLRRGIPPLSAFSLVSPLNNTTIITSVFNSSTVFFNWRRSGQGTTYKAKFGSPTISTPSLILPANNGGYDSVVTRVNSELDMLLGSLGLQPGDSLVGQYAVWAYNGLDSLKSTQTYNLTLRRQAKGNVIILYDSSSAAGITSKDSVVGVLNQVSETYDLFNRGTQTSTNAISLRGYKKVILLGQATNVMNTTLKDSVIAYLNSGGTTNQTKAKLLIYAEDFGYQFGRAASTYYDANFVSRLGWFWVSDRPSSGANQGLVGDYLNTGLRDSTIGSWPDVLRRDNTHGTSRVLYRFRIQINNPDSANAIGLVGSTYNVATFGDDIRSLRNAVGGPVGSPVYRFLMGGLTFVDSPTGIEPLSNTSIPERYDLSQNYPNPFNPSTKINFAIPKQGHVTLKVFDLLGREISVLVNNQMNAGYYTVDFNGSLYASGVYFYRLEAKDGSAGFTQIKKMVLIK